MRAENYCADCNTHYNASPEQHAETYHNNGLFNGITGGNFRDYQRRTRRGIA